MNEIQGDRIRKLKGATMLSILITFFLYFFANGERSILTCSSDDHDMLSASPHAQVAYIAAVPLAEAKASGQLIAAVFFTNGECSPIEV